MSLWSFQGACGPRPAPHRDAGRQTTGLSKLNSVRNVEVDVVPGEPSGRTSRAAPLLAQWDHEAHRTGSAPTGVKSSGFPRKEVIQPQLPLRLPCYDFTPIIDPTFDGSLPCGLGHRLRVLPASVV